jgi:hypothetical protein
VVELVSVVSNEPDNGPGDGNTTNDVVIVDQDTFRLRRAKRERERSHLHDHLPGNRRVRQLDDG